MNVMAKRENWKILAGVALVVLLAWAGWYWNRTRKQDEKVDKDIAASIKVDSDHKAQTEASARVDTLVDTVIVRDRALTSSARELRRASDTAGARAATLVDSSAMWNLRWQLAGMAYDTLSVAHTALLVVVDSLTADRNRWHVVADSAVHTMDALRDDLHVARKGCRVLPFVPCLSRKQTFVVGAVVGVVAYSQIRRKGAP